MLVLFLFLYKIGEPNKGFVNDVLPLDFVPGKYTVAVSDPSNNIRGMAFVSVSSPRGEVLGKSSERRRRRSWHGLCVGKLPEVGMAVIARCGLINQY